MAFNPLQSFLQGQQAGQGQQVNRLSGALAGQISQGQDIDKSIDFQKLMALDPDRANKIMTSFQNLSKERKESFYEDMVTGQAILSSGDVNGAIDFFGDRGEAINELGGDSFSNDYILNNLKGGTPEVALNSLNKAIDAGAKLGFVSGSSSAKNPIVSKSTMFGNGVFASVMNDGSRRVTDENGNVVKGEDAKLVIKEAKQKEKAARQEKSKLEISTARAKARMTGLVEREKEDITSGLTAAESIPILKRGLQLLDRVETGNPEEIALAFKKFLGIEGADEAELLNNLGKQVLKQLKPVFGSQFTANEARWLESMEAGFGKSTEANVRLIQQGLDLANARADIGINAAQSSGDSRTVDTIQGWRDYQFEDRKETDQEVLSRYGL